MIWGSEPRRQFRALVAWLRAQLFALPRLRRITTYRYARRLIWVSVELQPGVEKIYLADYDTYPANHFCWTMLAAGHRMIREHADETSRTTRPVSDHDPRRTQGG